MSINETAPTHAAFPPQPRVLFLTPFNFEDPAFDDEFDSVLDALLSEKTVSLVAEHVPPFEPTPTYEDAQARAVVKAVLDANNADFDAVVIACHYDPALEQARAVSHIPVVGPLQLTSSLTQQFGPKFAVITDVVEAESVIHGLIDGYGHGEACTGVTAIGWDGDAILKDTRGAAEAVDRIVATIAESGEAQSIVIGCTIVSAAYETHRDSLPDHGVVVLNSNRISLGAAATLAVN